MNDFWTKVREFAGPGIAIIIGVAFATSVFIAGTSLATSVEKHELADVTKYDLVITENTQARMAGLQKEPEPEAFESSGRVIERAVKTPGVAAINAPLITSGDLRGKNINETAILSLLPGKRTSLPFVEGRRPAVAGEVAISQLFQRQFNVAVNDKLTIITFPEMTAADYQAGKKQEKVTTELTVVGVHDKYYGAPESGEHFLLTTALPDRAQADLLGPATVSVTAGQNPAEVQKSLKEALPSAFDVQTPAQWIKARDGSLMQEAREVTVVVLGAFSVVALGVMSIIVVGTFGIILSRRAQTAALQRCIGATRSQLARSSLIEALTMSLIYSTLGVLVGGAFCYVAIRFISAQFVSLPKIEPALIPSDFFWPLVVGVVVSTCAAWLPSKRAARVSPLAALAPTEPVTDSGKKITAVTVAGIVAVAVGVLAMVFGVAQADTLGSKLMWGLAGGGLIFVGWNIANSVILPVILRAFGQVPARLAGIPGELAVENVVRHPGRTAMLTSAVMVGTTLIVMTSVAAASLVSTIGTTLSANTPYDGTIRGQFKDDAVLKDLQAAPGVAALRAERGLPGQAYGYTGTPAERPAVIEPGGKNVRQQDFRIVVSDPEFRAIARGAIVTPEVPRNTLLVPAGQMEFFGWKNGQAATLSIAGQTKSYTVKTRKNGFKILMNVEDAKGFSSAQVLNRVFLRFDDNAKPREVYANVQGVLAAYEGASVSSPIQQRATVERITNYVVMAISALLALSTLIALVGVANTVSLAIRERRKESSLIRALGVTSGQLRTMYVLETVIFATVAISVGTLLGIWFALNAVDVIGSQFARDFASTGEPVVVGSAADREPVVQIQKVVPWDRIAVIGLLSLGAAMLLTAVPAWKSAQVQPAAGLSRG